MATRIRSPQGKQPSSKTADKKRGIVLLVVVSLLALFILMGVAFSILALNYNQSAKTFQRVQEVGDPPQREAELILDQILFGSTGRSSLRHHDLLSDLYGINSGSDGILTSDATALDSGPYNAAANPPQQPQVWQFMATSPGLIYQTPGYYAGRVITFTSGNAIGHSTRVVESAYDPNTGNYAFAVEAIESKGPFNLRPNAGSTYFINGAPFNGAGAGFSTTAQDMSATYAGPDGSGGYLTPNLISLLPHFAGYDPNAGQFSDGVDYGGVDESWDAVDFQNMFLAMVPPIVATTPGVPLIPSYHRPELVNYWRTQMAAMPEFSAGPLDAFDLDNSDPTTTAATRNMLRTFIFRPMAWDHPNFSGSNPVFDYQNARAQALSNLGSTMEPAFSQEITRLLLDNLVNSANAPIWDIDNDNDGIPDSIWVDPGLPVVTSPDGRRYKRLVAICVKDLDGRLDLNAAGNLQQAVDANYRAETALPAAFGLASAGITIPRGVGFGPAEMQFLHILGNDPTAYGNLLSARYVSNLGGDASPGIPGVRDDLSIVKHHGVPNNYAAQFSWYASPPDVWGRGALALDVGGQPTTVFMGQNNEMLDTPYELSLSGQPNNADSPFTVIELERMLRYHDQDTAMLMSRPLLPSVAGAYLASESPGVIGPSEERRNLFTVHSSHIPAPATTLPREIRGNSGLAAGIISGGTILDVFRAKLVNAGVGEPQLSYELRKMVPWELMHGRKMDLNRWMGDGFDTNGDGTPDDPVEAMAENAWQGPAAFTGITAHHTNAIDADQSGPPANPGPLDNYYARQVYARHLFCLMAVLVPPTFSPAACPQEPTLSAANYRLLTLRRIAQWAINCAEFRDPDSIMTPFEYDANPTDGWHVDGNPATDGTVGNEERIYDPVSGSVVNVPNPSRDLVWGAEYPDLLISETLALHDRRVKDTSQASSGMSPDYKRTDTPMMDDDLDQFRVPQGSLYIELYCPRNSYNRNPLLPRELYDVSVPANPRLNLAKIAPGGRPVWRLAISKITKDAGTDATNHPRQPFEMAQSSSESASYDPLDTSLLPVGVDPAPQTLPIERYVWFSDASAAGIPAAELARTFYNTAAAPLVEPGQYAVVGPRVTTYLGSQDPASANPPAPTILWGGNSPQRIDLTAAGITIVDADGTTTTLTPGTQIRPVVPIIAHYPCTVGTTPISGGTPWGTVAWDIGLNITEPLATGNYYPEPNPSTAVTAMVGGDLSFYDDPDAPINDGTGFKDLPVEAANAANAGRPIYDYAMQASGTYDDAASVTLQRLANPNLAYNPLPNTDPFVAYNNGAPVNPYISVDWAAIDATVFSGEEDTDQLVGMVGIDPDDDPGAGNRPNGGIPRGTRQRGYMPTPPNVDSNFWNPVAQDGSNLPLSGGAGPYFRRNLNAPGTPPPPLGHTLGYVNATVGTPLPAPPQYLGEPSATATGQTCPWLTFNNRPFSNPMELLLVPSSAPGRLCSELTPGPFNAYTVANAYDGSIAPESLRSPFGHLLNLFHSSNVGASPNDGAQLARLLDYVEVPSPFLGAERWYNPNHFATAGTFRPPFNKVSRFRDAGRVNINTIYDKRIWDAVVARFPDLETIAEWSQLALSRQGYGTTLLSLTDVGGNPYPTRFAAPFRGADASDLMPDPPGPADLRKNRPVDATLLRPEPAPGDAANFNDDQPLFAMNRTTPTDNFRHTDRNPYFRYQGYQKLGNVLTTNSNVFAVWMTVGYFEVEPTTPSAAHPDGWVLGQEIGADAGEVKRHRAFYIIDRSIPVGYQPGQKLNTDDCILLRRFIE